jgi:hypothetical protein
MNDGIYGGTSEQEEGSESIADNSGSISVPSTGEQWDIFITVSGGDVFETDTEDGAGGAKTADGSAYVAIGRYRSSSVIEFRTAAAGSATVAWTAKRVVG